MLDQALAPYGCLQFRELYRAAPLFRQGVDMRSGRSEIDLFVYRPMVVNSRDYQE